MHVIQPPPPPPLTWQWRIATAFALSVWIFGLLAVAAWFTLTFLLMPAFPIASSLSLCTLILLLLAPLDLPPPSFLQRFFKFTMQASFHYFPVRVIYEDKDALYGGRPYVIGYEPHSVLPQGMCAFCEYAAVTPPPGLAHSRILVSTAGFWAPVMRHLWYWLGCRSVSKENVKKLLSEGQTVALCPGGVRECLYMQRGMEVAYLRKRRGFVRVALEHGAPLVPVFAFGQSDLFRYCRPFLDFPRGLVPRKMWGRVARRIGFAPMLVWGVWGLPMPFRVPITIVVGKPIECTDKVITDALVDQYLEVFIKELERLFVEYKQQAGYGEDGFTLRVV